MPPKPTPVTGIVMIWSDKADARFIAYSRNCQAYWAIMQARFAEGRLGNELLAEVWANNQADIKFMILEELPATTTDAELVEKRAYFRAEYDANLHTTGRQGRPKGSGRPLSRETRDKMRQAALARVLRAKGDRSA